MSYFRSKIFWVFFLTNCFYTLVFLVFIVPFMFIIVSIASTVLSVILLILADFPLLLTLWNQIAVFTVQSLIVLLSITVFLWMNYIISRMYLRRYKYEVNSEGVKITSGFRDSKLRLYSNGNISEVRITANLAELALGIYDVLLIPREGKKSKLALYNPGRIIGLNKEEAENIYRKFYRGSSVAEG